MHRSTGIGVSRWLGGLLGVALALPALALPQGCIELLAQAPRVDVVQGQQRDLRLAVPIERLAIGDPKIADVQLLDRRGFLVTGKEQGSTSLLIWTGCSPEPLRSLVEVEGRGSVDTRGAPAFTVGAAEAAEPGADRYPLRRGQPQQAEAGQHLVRPPRRQPLGARCAGQPRRHQGQCRRQRPGRHLRHRQARDST